MASHNTGEAPVIFRRSTATPAEDIAAYDRLPASLRAVLRDLPINMSAVKARENWDKRRRNGWKADEYARDWRRALAARMPENTALAYGPKHPQAAE